MLYTSYEIYRITKNKQGGKGMFKKVVSAIMVAAMVGTMVAPVSVSAKDGGKTIELWTCWTEGADTEKASQEMIQKWEEETGNTVNQTNFTYDMLHEKILTAAAGGNVPDLIWGLPEDRQSQPAHRYRTPLLPPLWQKHRHRRRQFLPKRAIPRTIF